MRGQKGTPIATATVEAAVKVVASPGVATALPLSPANVDVDVDDGTERATRRRAMKFWTEDEDIKLRNAAQIHGGVGVIKGEHWIAITELLQGES